MKLFRTRNVILGAITFLLLFFQNCSRTDFTFEALKENSVVEDFDSDTGKKIVSEDLGVLVTQSKQLDIVWVIDNSGSMNQEAAHVRANYQLFIQSLASYAEVKTALISRKGNSGTSVEIPQGADPTKHIQINKNVSSIDSLCLAQTTLFSMSEINQAPSNDYLGVCRKDSRLSLENFYRPSSQKIYIFVTDDEERLTNAQSFNNIFSNKFNQSPIVYSFIGLGRSVSPCQSREGAKYKELSNLTNGAIFNICDMDWSSHFNKLVNHVVTSIKNSFSLKHSQIHDVLEVKIDDEVVPDTKYTVQNGLLTIEPSLLLHTSKRVHIKYTLP